MKSFAKVFSELQTFNFDPARYNLIRRGIIPRRIRSPEVSYRAGSDPPRYYTAPDQIRRGIIPRWIKSATYYFEVQLKRKNGK
jgi:hypothetical protein